MKLLLIIPLFVLFVMPVSLTANPEIIRDDSSSWILVKNVDPFTDESVLRYVLNSENEIQGRFNNVHARLNLQVADNKSQIYVDWDQFITTESTEVKYRIDKQVPVTQSWSMSTNYEATFASSPDRLLGDLLDAEKFIISVVPHGENSVVAEFDLKGLKEFMEASK